MSGTNYRAKFKTATKLQRADRLRQNILTQAFIGKLA
jgi:hypothetical protein